MRTSSVPDRSGSYSVFAQGPGRTSTILQANQQNSSRFRPTSRCGCSPCPPSNYTLLDKRRPRKDIDGMRAYIFSQGLHGRLGPPLGSTGTSHSISQPDCTMPALRETQPKSRNAICSLSACLACARLPHVTTTWPDSQVSPRSRRSCRTLFWRVTKTSFSMMCFYTNSKSLSLDAVCVRHLVEFQCRLQVSRRRRASLPGRVQVKSEALQGTHVSRFLYFDTTHDKNHRAVKHSRWSNASALVVGHLPSNVRGAVFFPKPQFPGCA